MTTLLLVACIGMIAGSFLMLRLSPLEFTQGIFKRLTSAPRSIRNEINESTGRRKRSVFRREIAEAQSILKATGKEAKFPMVCALSLLLFALGAAIAIVLGNVFLVPVLAVGLMFVPFWYIRLTAGHFKKDVSTELETALSIITTAYLRNEDIRTAVEENLSYLNPPVQGVFKEFAVRLRVIDPDVDAAISDLRSKLDNVVFREWCDAVAACQYDRSLKTTLTPIVSKLSDMRVVNGELENLVFAPRKEFITMAAMVILNIPILWFINKDWFNTLMYTAAGQVVMAVCAATIFVSFAFVVKLTQPIEYRR